MGRMYYKQPNGLITIFSTITDCPIHWNVNKEHYINIRLNEERKQIEKEAKEIFDDENPYCVRNFEKMKDKFLYNIESKEEFEEYLKDVGYEGSIGDFKYIVGITWNPKDEE